MQSHFTMVMTLKLVDHWTNEAVVWKYKELQIVERRFPVPKDPNLVGPVYLDVQDRVEALGNVLLMPLLV